MRITLLAASLSAVLLSGCAYQPLVFASGVTVGVGVKVSTASTTPLSVTVGYDQIDSTVVPVTTGDGKSTFAPIRACSDSTVGASGAVACAEAAPAPGEAAVNAAFRSAAIAGRTTMSAAQFGLTPFRLTPAVMAAPPPPPPGAPSGYGDQTDGESDALSVFSSFNGNITAVGGGAPPSGATSTTGSTANVGVGLGKVFATGIAAQNLTTGEEQFESYKGQALVYNPAACLASLEQTLTGSDGKPARAATDDEILMCKATPPAVPDAAAPQPAQQQSQQAQPPQPAAPAPAHQ